MDTILIDTILSKYNNENGSEIPMLQDIQSKFGYIPKDVLKYISKNSKYKLAHLYGIVTFYAQFSIEPKGKHIIQVCDGTACHVRGSSKIISALQQKFNVDKENNTTEDLYVTVETVSCLGACALAPAIVVDGRIYGNLVVTDIEKIIKEMESGD